MAPHNRWDAEGYHAKWLENAERQGVPGEVVSHITRRHGVTPESFTVLEKFIEIKDPGGKSFFLVPRGARGVDARSAALMTYILNAGTDYGATGKQPTDFPETPYSGAEVQRIINRQNMNGWSYSRDVGFVHRNRGRLVTTPNGMLMGVGGNWIQRPFSQRGGTTWGDIFMVNMGKVTDPAEQLSRIVRSGRVWYTDAGRPFQSKLDLDRVLHHEERHSQQWAAKGYVGMLRGYSWELIREWAFGKTNRLEADAGLSDGGYR